MNEIELGIKRRCISCGTKFYDFLKSPITCPSCGAEFDPEQLLKSRKGRVSIKAVEVVPDKVAKEKDEFDADPLLASSDDEQEIEADDGLPSDDDASFVPVKSDDEEETVAKTKFDDDEDFIDEVADDITDEDEE